MIQTILVLLTFVFAVGFMIKKFVWNPFETSKNSSGNKAGTHSDCGSCSLH